jgi:hypothetical protein
LVDSSAELGIPNEKGSDSHRSLRKIYLDFSSRATHALPTVVAQVAIPVSHRDRSAVVAGGGVTLKTGELAVAAGGLERGGGALEVREEGDQPVGAGVMAVSVAVRMSVRRVLRFGLGGVLGAGG